MTLQVLLVRQKWLWKWSDHFLSHRYSIWQTSIICRLPFGDPESTYLILCLSAGISGKDSSLQLASEALMKKSTDRSFHYASKTIIETTPEADETQQQVRHTPCRMALMYTERESDREWSELTDFVCEGGGDAGDASARACQHVWDSDPVWRSLGTAEKTDHTHVQRECESSEVREISGISSGGLFWVT